MGYCLDYSGHPLDLKKCGCECTHFQAPGVSSSRGISRNRPGGCLITGACKCVNFGPCPLLYVTTPNFSTCGRSSLA